MTSVHTRVAAIVAALTTAVLLTSCGTAAKEDQGTGASASSTSQVATHNADDVLFAQSMMPHHQQAIDLAAMVPDRSTNPEMLTLAATIAGQQQPEIATMKALLMQWDVNPDEMSHPSGHAGMAMAGMVDDATMVKLDSLKGADFDILWLQSMITHHQGAIEMAKAEIADGKNVDMTTLARNMIAAQQAEIDQMKLMLVGMGA
jgi:uncharacterized protein (DUF305 family)